MRIIKGLRGEVWLVRIVQGLGAEIGEVRKLREWRRGEKNLRTRAVRECVSLTQTAARMRRTKVEDDFERRESKKRGKRRKRRAGRRGELREWWEELAEVRRVRERRGRGDLREWREELGEVRKGKGLEAGRGEKAGW